GAARRSAGVRRAGEGGGGAAASSEAEPADFVCVLDGQRFSANAAENPGFRDRVAGSLLDAMNSGPSSAMTRRGEDGSILLLAEHLPDEVVEWFPDIWTYLLDGEWPRATETLRDHMRKQRAQNFLGLQTAESGGEQAAMLVFGANLVNLPDNKQHAASCMRFVGSGVREVPLDPAGTWDNPDGAVVMRVGPRSMVQLDGEDIIYVKLNGSSNYVYITRHKLLKNRHLRAAVMRPYTSQYPKFGSGVVLFLHASPREARRRPELTRVAAWPAFWLVVYARSDGREVYSCQSCEVLPGGLRELSDGALVLLSKHESLRHMLLSIYPVSPEERVPDRPADLGGGKATLPFSRACPSAGG
ncbi:unnamed protein product, partial [Prorocentrum cordatum]